jgi:TonB family protein
MRRPTLVAVSLSSHVVLVVALLVAGLWHLDRLQAARRPFDLAVVQRPLPAPAGGGHPAKLPALVPKRHRHVVKQPVQPVPRAIAQVPVTEPAEVPGTGAGTGSGSAVGEGSNVSSDPGSGSGAPCPTAPCGDLPRPKVRPATRLVPPTVIRGLRISGETQIRPPDPVKTAMLRDGHHRSMALVELCLDPAGTVTTVKVVRSSGYPAYDQVLAEGVQAWRYRPYEIGGQAEPVCGMVTFIYAID